MDECVKEKICNEEVIVQVGVGSGRIFGWWLVGCLRRRELIGGHKYTKRLNPKESENLVTFYGDFGSVANKTHGFQKLLFTIFSFS